MASPNTVRRTTRHREQTGRVRAVMVTALVLGLVAVLLFAFVLNRGAGIATGVDDRLEYDPMLGNPAARVTIIEYGAYGCSACRAWHQAGIIEQMLTEFPDQVRFIFRDFPIIVPNYDRMAAAIAQCALDQSQAGFWSYHDLLYSAAAPGNTQEQLIALGEQAGLDQATLQTCVTSGTHRETVEYDLKRAISLGLPGTPSFLVNDARVFNATPDVLRAAILDALRQQP